LRLTRVQVGALFAVASVAMVVVTLPIGVVTDRLGARRLTLAAAVLVALSALGQGLARASSGSCSPPAPSSASVSARCGRPGSPSWPRGAPQAAAWRSARRF